MIGLASLRGFNRGESSEPRLTIRQNSDRRDSYENLVSSENAPCSFPRGRSNVLGFCMPLQDDMYNWWIRNMSSPLPQVRACVRACAAIGGTLYIHAHGGNTESNLKTSALIRSGTREKTQKRRTLFPSVARVLTTFTRLTIRSSARKLKMSARVS